MTRVDVQAAISASGVTVPVTPVALPVLVQSTGPNAATPNPTDQLALANATISLQKNALLQQQNQLLALLALVLIDVKETVNFAPGGPQRQ